MNIQPVSVSVGINAKDLIDLENGPFAQMPVEEKRSILLALLKHMAKAQDAKNAGIILQITQILKGLDERQPTSENAS